MTHSHCCPRMSLALPSPLPPRQCPCHTFPEDSLLLFQPAGVPLVSVYASPNDQMLWALDSRWNVHVRVGITEEMPVGTDWEHVPGRREHHCMPGMGSRGPTQKSES